MKLLVFLLLPWLSLSEVEENFSKCKEYFLNDYPPQFTLRSSVHICQCLKDNNGKKKYLYATLYNTAWRIPIYSAYVFGRPSPEREDPWYIEPQLDIKYADPCMGPQDPNQDIGNNQAVNRDYKGSGYDRGHLYPVQHTNNRLSMLATSTLTNAAPQDSDFNRIEWKEHEKAVITALEGCDKAYVVTGVVPDTNIKIPKDNPRVTVSKYYWRATCCQKGKMFTGQGYFGPDKKNSVEPLSIAKLQNKMAKDYKVNIVIFPSLPPGAKRPRDNGCTV